jgi:hypothetical protein
LRQGEVRQSTLLRHYPFRTSMQIDYWRTLAEQEAVSAAASSISDGDNGAAAAGALSRILQVLHHPERVELLRTIEPRIGENGPVAGVIGAAPMISFPKSGKLSCFANDVWAMYFNNRGSVMLTVDLGQGQRVEQCATFSMCRLQRLKCSMAKLVLPSSIK